MTTLAEPRAKGRDDRPRTAIGRLADGRFFFAILIALRIIMLLSTIRAIQLNPDRLDDARRLQQIATTDGRPWRDVEVEYAPVEVVLVRLVAGSTTVDTGIRLALLAFLGDVVTFAILRRVWGHRAGIRYLALGTPLLPLIYYHFDPIPTAMAVGAVALASRGRERIGGTTLALAMLAKVWAVVLAPMWVLERRRSALAWFLGFAAIGGLSWIAYGGTGAPGQVATFRHATGWHVASVVGDVVWLLTGGPAFVHSGTIRVGSVPGWAPALLIACGLALIVLIWRRARDWPGPPAGAPALAAVTALCLVSPLFSVQYVWWLLPFAAVATLGPRGRVFGGLTAAASVLSIAIAYALVFGEPHVAGTAATVGRWLVLARNISCVAIVASFIWYARRETGARS